MHKRKEGGNRKKDTISGIFCSRNMINLTIVKGDTK